MGIIKRKKEDDNLRRIERIMYKLGKLWTLNPEQRFGQLLFNYTRIGTRVKGQVGVVRDPFYYDDMQIEYDLMVALGECVKK